ncbi:DUF4190 domain-containing protein [Pimelobacter simplex]|uniref:DUF4190 domain-containing protein n=1 Tax=Nocardioides simplex TaxID=2045 RepID=UPI00366C85A9
MSDPYGSNPQNPYGGGQGNPNPYGAPQGGGYGPPSGGGYPGAPGGYDATPPKTDGMSIAALVLSFLCCLAPIGVILGFVGLKRTKGGQRKGRGLAIGAIVVGLVMSVTVGVIGAIVFVFASSIVTPGNAEAGQCVDVSREKDTVVLRKKDCTETHDAEVVAVAKVDNKNLTAIKTGMTTYCLTAMSKEYQTAVGAGFADLKAVIEDPDDISVGDHLLCYYQPGKKLTKPLL